MQHLRNQELKGLLAFIDLFQMDKKNSKSDCRYEVLTLSYEATNPPVEAAVTAIAA